MVRRSFWTKQRTLPGQSAVEDAVETYWMLRLIHRPSAAAMALGAVGGGYLGWRFFRESGAFAVVIGIALGAFVGAWLGLLLYWLVRFIVALND